MPFANYTQLKSTIARWLNRADLTADIPDFIALVEASFRKELPAQGVRVVSQISLTVADAGATALPSAVKLNSITLDTTVTDGKIDIVTPEELFMRRIQYGATGMPRAACVQNGTLLVAPVPDTDYLANITYDAELTPLSDSVATNWLLDNHPDLYLYGALIHSAPFLKDDARMALWEQRFNGEMVKLAADRWHAEFGANPIARPRKSL